jgi:hypothetical protein
MPFANIVIGLLVIGLALWLINRYAPMPSNVRMIVNAIAAVGIGIWLLQVTGLWGSVSVQPVAR